MRPTTSDISPQAEPGATLPSATISGATIGATTASAPSHGAAIPGASSVLSTLNQDGSRRWLRPKPSFGPLWRYRRAIAYILIAVFTLIPYLKLNGMPLVLLDLTTRRFTIFGTTFLPTDTLLLALLLVGIFLAIFLLTALIGRVWCGWGCPQTVYLEFVYRPIERFFEGTPGRVNRGRFVGSPAAKILKYVAFALVSCFLAHTFLAYFVGVERLAQWVTRSPFEHPTPFLVMAFVTGAMLFDFGYFREQTCLVACPYGRFQSVLLDRQSMIVSYDPNRGEPRGRVAKRAEGDVALPVLGDCVDCGLCVTTCPTGIDIRNGLQMECVNCTQCIDACNAVMHKLGRKPGLIRYTSQAALAGEKPRIIRARTIIYPAILMLIATAFGVLLYTKAPADVIVLRARGNPYTLLSAQEIANPVEVKIINRTREPQNYTITAQAGELTLDVRTDANPVRVEAGEMRRVPALLVAPATAFQNGRLYATVAITDGSAWRTQSPFRLAGPWSAAAPSNPDGGPAIPKEAAP